MEEQREGGSPVTVEHRLRVAAAVVASTSSKHPLGRSEQEQSASEVTVLGDSNSER